MIMTQFSVGRIDEEDFPVLLDFVVCSDLCNENINIQNDAKFHGLSEYAISFKKKIIL